MIVAVTGYGQICLKSLIKAIDDTMDVSITSTTGNTEATSTDHILMNDTIESYTLTCGHSIYDPCYYVDESLNALSLRRLRELMFVPRKLQLQPIYNQKPRKTLIRNTLPQRIRTNEKAER